MPPVKAPTQKKTVSKAPKAPKTPDREVLYPKVEVNICSTDGIGPVTVEQAKQLLGWQEEVPQSDAGPGVKFGADKLLTDENGNGVRCTNNTHNRPFREEWCRQLAQDILHSGPGLPPEKRRWQFNLETIIIGRTGRVESGQHRLIALVLAGQIWAKEDHWKEIWPTEPTLETLVAFGAAEDGSVTRTFDNVCPRSGSDVLYTSDFFSSALPADRKAMCSICDTAVKMLWERTGATDDAWAPRRTHSEMLEFIERHKRVVQAVQHIYEERAGVSRYLSLGFAAAVLYLMGASETDPTKYHEGDVSHRSEKQLDFDRWDRACEFFAALNKGKAPWITTLKATSRPLEGDNGGWSGKVFSVNSKDNGSLSERLLTLSRAWTRFAANKPIREEDLQLREGDDYVIERNDDGTISTYSLHVSANFGGIDLAREDRDPEVTPDEDEVEEAKEELAKEDLSEKAAEPAKARKGVEQDPDEVRRKHLEAHARKNGQPETVKTDETTFAGQLAAIREANPGVVLLFKMPKGYRVWQDDATTVARLGKSLGITQKIEQMEKIPLADIPANNYRDVCAKLKAAGHRCGLVERVAKGEVMVKMIER